MALIPVRTEQVDILRRLADFHIKQDPGEVVTLTIASEDGYFMGGNWSVSERDDRRLGADATRVVMRTKASDLGLTDPTLAQMALAVATLVLRGDLKTEVQVTLTAVDGGAAIPGARWSISEPGATEPIFVGNSGETYTLTVFANKTLRVFAPGYQTYMAPSIDLTNDLVQNIPLTAEPVDPEVPE